MFKWKNRGTVHPENAEIREQTTLVAQYMVDLDELSAQLTNARGKNEQLVAELREAKKTTAGFKKTIADLRRSPSAEISRLKDRHNVEMRKIRDEMAKCEKACDEQLTRRDEEVRVIRLEAVIKTRQIQAYADRQVYEASKKAMQEAMRQAAANHAVLKKAQAAEPMTFLDDDTTTQPKYVCGVCRETKLVEKDNTSVYDPCGHCICTTCAVAWSNTCIQQQKAEFLCPTCREPYQRAFPIYFP